ncbi:glycosyltransferase [Candidatus Saccharibacteria bacterium]|nr:MAG: glycosyltransferase [Candidatus Saccharibacteria bacterium]
MEPRKNLVGLIDAYQKLKPIVRNQYALVIGGGKGWKDDEIISSLNRLRASGATIFQTGFVSDKERAALYMGATLYVMPSHYEGFGMQLLEGMTYGVPMLVSDIPVLREVAGDAAAYCGTDPSSIAVALENLLSTPDRREKLVQAGKKRLHSFSWKMLHVTYTLTYWSTFNEPYCHRRARVWHEHWAICRQAHRKSPRPTAISFIYGADKIPRLAALQKLAPSFDIVPSDIKEFTFAEQLALKRQIQTLRPDLVHFTIVQQPVFYRGVAVTTMHDLTTLRFRNPAKNTAVFWAKQQVYKWVNKRVARKSVAVITPSDFVKQDVARYCSIAPSKITVTHEAAEAISDAAESVELLAGKVFLMYTGRPTPHKNLGRLIDTFAVLQKHTLSLC